MTEHIFIVGGSNESINAAIAMASIDKPVTLISPNEQIVQTLTHYRFERQMVSLWDLYLKEQKIIVNDSVETTIKALSKDGQYNHATFWLFMDTLSSDTLNHVLERLQSPHYRVILSGMCAIGHAESLAKKLATAHVFYLPFIFMKDGMNFSSLVNPEFVLLGEKTLGDHLYCPAVNFFINSAKLTQIADIKTIEFARNTIITLLATRLSFINELARLADVMDVDITQIQKIIAKDRRIGKDYLSAGWGFGGKAMPSELRLLVQAFKQTNVESTLIQTVIDINENQKELIFRKFWLHFEGFIEDKTVVIWGAGYRTGTGLTTNSAIHPLLKLLWSYNIKTCIHTTNTGFELQDYYGDEPLFELVTDAYSSLNKADALFIINGSKNQVIDIDYLNKVAIPVFDGKNIIDNLQKAKLVGTYYGIGR